MNEDYQSVKELWLQTLRRGNLHGVSKKDLFRLDQAVQAEITRHEPAWTEVKERFAGLTNHHLEQAYAIKGLLLRNKPGLRAIAYAFYFDGRLIDAANRTEVLIYYGYMATKSQQDQIVREFNSIKSVQGWPKETQKKSAERNTLELALELATTEKGDLLIRRALGQIKD